MAKTLRNVVTNYGTDNAETVTVTVTWGQVVNGATWAGTVAKAAGKHRPILECVQIAAGVGNVRGLDRLAFTGTDSYALHTYVTDSAEAVMSCVDQTWDVSVTRVTQVRADLLLAAVKSWVVHKLPLREDVTVTVNADAVTFAVGRGYVSPLSVPTDDGAGAFPSWCVLTDRRGGDGDTAEGVALNPKLLARIATAMGSKWGKDRPVRFDPIVSALKPVRYAVTDDGGVGHGLLMPVRVS